MNKNNCINVKKIKKMKASLTVEASVLIPFTLFIIVGGINLGYDLFRQAQSASEIDQELVELDPVEIVRKNTMIQEFGK